jgi:hypothetical protein
LEVYMIVNFMTRRISQTARKLVRTSILINLKKDGGEGKILEYMLIITLHQNLAFPIQSISHMTR